MNMPNNYPLKYPTPAGARALIVEGHEAVASSIMWQLQDYFRAKKLEFHCDRSADVDSALIQLKYYEYDIAIVAIHPADGEHGTQFLETLRKKRYDFPVILFGIEADRKKALDASDLGVIGFFIKTGKAAQVVPEMVDQGILMYRTMREQNHCNMDLREKNTELKQVNELLARQSVRLLKLRKEQESQRARMGSILNSMSDGVVFINSSREVEMINPSARRAFGLAENATLGPADLEKLTGADPFESPASIEVPLLLNDRNYKMISLEVSAEGELMGRMMVLHDVTQDMEMERVKAEFQSMVSHELRTPLTAIRGAVENFLRGSLGPITDQQKKFLEMMMRNVDRQSNLVDNVLDLAKLDAKMMVPRLAMVDPAYIVRLSYESFRYPAQEKGIELLMEIEDGSPHLLADERMLTQILDNLVSNSVKFTPAGGRVAIGAGKRTLPDGMQAVALTVIDTGIGVPENLREKIFESYYQADSGVQRKFKGTGLGLSISKRMAELHRGTLTCEEAPGGGSRFVLTIPAEGPGTAKVLLLSSAQNRAGDERAIAEAYNVVPVLSPEEVMGSALAVSPHAVILDLDAGTGELVKAVGNLKQFPQTSKIPVIFISRDAGETGRLIGLGADGIVMRPYGKTELLNTIKRFVDGQK